MLKETYSTKVYVHVIEPFFHERGIAATSIDRSADHVFVRATLTDDQLQDLESDIAMYERISEGL